MNKLIVNLMIIFATAFLFVSVAEAKKGGFTFSRASGVKAPIQTKPIFTPKATPPKTTIPKKTIQKKINLKDIYKDKDGDNRATNTTSKADKPLEPVSPTKSTHGHGHSKHGHQTTAQQQKDRVATGNAKVASKFSNPKMEAEALGRGKKALNEKIKNENIPKFKNGEPNRVTVIVGTNNPKGFGNAYVRKLDNNGNPIRDSNGQYVTEKSKDVLKNTKIIYEYVPSKNDWSPVTYYPVK